MKELLLSHRGAITSACGFYRYRLWRRWRLRDCRQLVFLMLNPSTADATEDDPTIRRCIGFARRLGFGGIEVVNLYARRCMDPSRLSLLGGGMQLEGADNDQAIAEATQARTVVAAWGAGAGLRPDVRRHMETRAGHVLDLLGGGWVERVVCLGTTAGGHPRHPLYVRGDAELVPFDPAKARCA